MRHAQAKWAGQAPLLPDELRHRIAAQVEAGDSLNAVARQLNDEGVPTARGGRWQAATVAHVVRSVALDAELAETARIGR